LLHLLYEPFKAFLRLFINLRKVGVQPAACQKIGVYNFIVPAVLNTFLGFLLIWLHSLLIDK